jgi:isoaspartyl peptidase/L-asparaginase-like protein (Ntn-hydrolase superfamily)
MKKRWLLRPLRTIAGGKGLATSGREKKKEKKRREENNEFRRSLIHRFQKRRRRRRKKKKNDQEAHTTVGVYARDTERGREWE